MSFDPLGAWRLAPQVSLRPEPFGALLYHFGTRRLSFLKTPVMVAVVQGLAQQPTAWAACLDAGVGPDELAAYEAALAGLAATATIVPVPVPARPAEESV